MYRGLPIILLGLLVGVLLAGCTRAEPGQAINKTAAQVPILMYHHIGAPPNPNDTRAARLYVAPDQLDRQLTEIQQAGYTTITLDDLVSALNGGAALPDKPLILTFDDGYQDFYSNAYPLLQHHHDKATAYIITGRVGKSGYMTWDELAELASAPLITIGAHTQTHPHLAKHSTTRVRDEL
jgi:peptidoglycan/xylan/chitin deacetylase (PgdA/CDA1 family)